MAEFKYISWKFIFILVFTLVTILRTDCLQVKRLSKEKFDTRLCPYDEVSNITKVYVGGKLTSNWNKTDYILEVNSTTLNDVFKETLDKCNSTPVCHGSLYAIDNWQYTTTEGQVDITYQVIEYNCVPPDTDFKYVSKHTNAYMTIPPCPFGSRIFVDDVYIMQKCYGHECVTDLPSEDRILEIKKHCNGKIICDSLFIKLISMRCFTCYRAGYIIIKYHCTAYDNNLYQVSCDQQNRVISQSISCYNNDTSIIIKDIWIGHTERTCNFSKTDCVKKLRDVKVSQIQDKCFGESNCQIDVKRYQISCTRNVYGNYIMVIYQCSRELIHRKFCINEYITLNCTEGNVIHINTVAYGDYKYYTGCESLKYDFSKWKTDSYCEKNVTLHNMTFYNEVMSSCNGKIQCDESLQAIAGLPIGPCYDNIMRLPDYVAVNYYCEAAVERTTQSTEFTLSTEDSQQTTEASSDAVIKKENQTSNPEQTGNSSSNLIISVVVPVVVLVVLVITVIMVVLVYRRRSLSANQSNQQTSSGNEDIGCEQPESVTFPKTNTIDQDYNNTGRDTIRRRVSDDYTDPGVLYENAAFVDERNEISERATPEMYAEVDKAMVKKKRQTIDKSKDTVDSTVYSLATISPEDGATSVMDVENHVYDKVKDERNVIEDETTIVDNVGYIRH